MRGHKEQTNVKNTGKHVARLLLSAANTLRLLSASVFGLILNYTLLHHKSPNLLDAYIYCIAATGLLMVISGWGGREYATRELSLGVANQPKILGGILLGRFSLAVVLSLVIISIPGVNYALPILLLLVLRTSTSVFEAYVIVQKRFGFSLLTELIVNGLFIILLYTDKNTSNINVFFTEWLLFEGFRLAIYTAFFGRHVSLKVPVKEVFFRMKHSTPFFAVALAGFACSRADLYVLGFSMQAADFSRYAILANFIILCQVMFGAFFGAFTSNILRLANSSFYNFRKKLFGAGLVFAAVGTIAIHLLSDLFFADAPGWVFLTLVFANLFAFTGTFTSVYHFTRLNKQGLILQVIVVAGIFNLLTSAFIVPRFGINGAFACNTMCALLTMLLFSIGIKPARTNL